MHGANWYIEELTPGYIFLTLLKPKVNMEDSQNFTQVLGRRFIIIEIILR